MPRSPAIAPRPVPRRSDFRRSGGPKQLEYTWTLTLAGRYVDFWTLTERALDYAFARVPSVDRTLRPQLLDAYLRLERFADARTALAELKARGARLAILSNGSPRNAVQPPSKRPASPGFSMPCSRSMPCASTSRGRKSMRS